LFLDVADQALMIFGQHNIEKEFSIRRGHIVAGTFVPREAFE
jgi:hypothetical protein